MIVTGLLLAFIFNTYLGDVVGEVGGIWRWMLVIATLPKVKAMAVEDYKSRMGSWKDLSGPARGRHRLTGRGRPLAFNGVFARPCAPPIRSNCEHVT